jgi:hypothetical protein
MSLIIPPWIIPEQESHEWLDEGSSVFPAAFAPGIAQRQSFGGPRIKLSRSHRVRLDEFGMLISLLKDTRGRYEAVHSKVHFQNRGSLAAGELLTNNTFASGTSGWSVSGELSLTVNNRILRATRTAVTTDQTLRTSVATVVSGAAYVARAFVRRGLGVMAYRFRLGTAAGLSDIATDSVDRTAQDLGQLAGVASGTSMHFSVFDESTGKSANDFVELWYASLSRCPLVNGSSQTGSTLSIDGLPASTDGLLMPGDWIGIGNELKMMTAPLNSTSTGAGVLHFSPALVRSPIDNDPVIVSDPMGKFLISNVKISNEFGTQATVTYDLEHIYE